MNPTGITFEAPGPGEWMLDTTHHGRRPLARFMAESFCDSFEAGMAELLARYGLPLQTVESRLVNGCQYVRPTAIGDDGSGSAPPPRFVLWAVARLHPELRRRNATARAAWSERRWRDDVDDWFGRERAEVVGKLRAIQAVDVAALADEELVRHLDETRAFAVRQGRLGMSTHGDILATGDYFAHCVEWGIDTAAAADLLRGSSPASSEVARLLAPVGAAVERSGRVPQSIGQVRDLGDDVGAAVDEWLELHAWRVVDSDDVDGTTLAERPALQLAAVLAAGSEIGEVVVPDPTPVRERVPAERRAEFDLLLDEARYAMQLRDDNVGIRWNWPVGLVRRALLEVGDRLVAADRLEERDDVVELAAEEVGPLLLHGEGPSGEDVAARMVRRRAVEAAGPPDTLGPAEEPPPLDVFPPALRRATRAMLAMIDVMEGDGAAGPLRGAGVGSTPYRGTARVVAGAEDALQRLGPGEVLVAPFTGPAYNSILPILGGVVVEEGGPLCHAAIVARELGIPALVGVSGATETIVDGEIVEIDPAAGVVRRAESTPPERVHG